MNSLLVSKTGRKKRKDSFEAQHDMKMVKKILQELYVDKQLSTTKIPIVLLEKYNIKISDLKCFYILQDMGILRDKSESVSIARSAFDYKQSLLTRNLIDIIDGLVIGDASIGLSNNNKTARLSISGKYKEFIVYCRGLVESFKPSEVKYYNGEKGEGTWSFYTKFHPDLGKMYFRWYNNGIKDVPPDINLSPITILLWYLGDGSISAINGDHSRSLKFSTNSFSREAIENILVKKMLELGIEASRVDKSNQLFIKTSSIVSLINYIGKNPPVKCYSYKFDIEEWRLKKSMKNASRELDVKYNRLANWVKSGSVRHSRSPGGKKVLFSNEEFNELKDRLNKGELSRDKGKRAAIKPIAINAPFSNHEFTRKSDEPEGEFFDRIADICHKRGFPYKIYNQEKKEKLWTRLRNSQYIIPEGEIIKWRTNELSLADSFHPYLFDMNCKNKISPLSLFNNKDELINCLQQYLKIGGILTWAGVSHAVCRSYQSKRVNNFSPAFAKDIYNYYCDDGYKVLDFCAGFSGRLLGASATRYKDIQYIGIDPNIDTFNGLIETKKFLHKIRPDFKCNIIDECAEDCLIDYRSELFDFIFTSPPYFDKEVYSRFNNQSSIRYPIYSAWLKCFLKTVLKEAYRVLKKGRKCVINIGKADRHDIPNDLIEIAEEIGFKNIEQKYIEFGNYRFVNGSNTRLEPMIIMEKL